MRDLSDHFFFVLVAVGGVPFRQPALSLTTDEEEKLYHSGGECTRPREKISLFQQTASHGLQVECEPCRSCARARRRERRGGEVTEREEKRRGEKGRQGTEALGVNEGICTR